MKNRLKNKTTRNNFITYGVVILIYIVMQILTASGSISSTMQGLLVPICAYVVMAISLNLTVGILGRAVPGPRGLHERGCLYRRDRRRWRFPAVCPPAIVCLIVAMVVGAVFAAIVGFLIGIPVLRLQGDYLAIVTLAFGEIIKGILNNLYVGIDSNGLHMSLLSDKTNLAEGGKLIISGPMGLTSIPQVLDLYHRHHPGHHHAHRGVPSGQQPAGAGRSWPCATTALPPRASA